MKQTNIYDFLEELAALVEEAEAEATAEQDETPTKVDEPEEGNPTLIDDVITGFLKHCKNTNSIPSLDQAKSIAILDAINRSYQ